MKEWIVHEALTIQWVSVPMMLMNVKIKDLHTLFVDVKVSYIQ